MHLVMPRIGKIIISISHVHDKQKYVDERDFN
jgi:hypothetical protein